MCFFPTPNLNFNGKAYRAGIREFECGACPECMQKRSSVWALRAVHEANSHAFSCMITLTYDTFRYDSEGNCLGENPVNPDLRVDKKHVQDFMKRLRKHFEYTGEKIRYIICAEYGSRTHRAHYHAILFGVNFSDRVFYKKSKRGNPIYMSATLTKLWSHGICTVDCINVRSSVARYCTKYCAKNRSDETFMLFSQSLGLDSMLQSFNAHSYFVDGREFPIPRSVWQRRISQKYKFFQIPFDYRYKNRNHDILDPHEDSEYQRANRLRENYKLIRDRDDEFCEYLFYWRRKQKLFKLRELPVEQRIRNLDEKKYHFYKEKALRALSLRRLDIPVVSPGSNSRSYFSRFLAKFNCHLNEDGSVAVPLFSYRKTFLNRFRGFSFGDVSKFDTFPVLQNELIDEINRINSFKHSIDWKKCYSFEIFEDEDEDFEIFADLPRLIFFGHLPFTSRLKTASDTKKEILRLTSEQISYIEDIGLS